MDAQKKLNWFQIFSALVCALEIYIFRNVWRQSCHTW